MVVACSILLCILAGCQRGALRLSLFLLGAMYRLLNGDCLNTMPTLEENSIDAIVTDPPYGLSFMGKDWDHGVPGEAFWREALRVAKPGAHLLAFGGSRTVHRLTCAIEDAGWEIRDTIMWVYGSGFPKSHNVSKAIDKEAGAEREYVGEGVYASRKPRPYEGGTALNISVKDNRQGNPITAPGTPLARQWDGWGTALKPAHEPIIMARKPFPGTVAQNVTTWGTGAINVDGGRVDGIPWQAHDATGLAKKFFTEGVAPVVHEEPHPNGRWPANLIHDGSEEVLAGFPVTGPSKAAPRGGTNPNPMDWGNARADGDIVKGHNDNGGNAARFFYCAKASKADRDEGLDGFAHRQYSHDGRETATEGPHQRNSSVARNHHPTVKPTDLMRYLVRLVTPPDGIVLDPFMGSGSTGKAAMLEGFGFVGIEREREYIDIAAARIGAAVEVEPLFREYT